MSAPTCSIVHALERRVRLRAPALCNRRDAGVEVAEQLAREPGCEVVTINPRTGSVLIESTEARLDAEALRRRVNALLQTVRDEGGRPLTEGLPERHPGPTRVARAVAHAFAGINADFREALDGRADLGTLLPVVFAVAGLAEVAVSGKMPAPAWFNLLWWSQRTFMTFNISAVEEEARAARDQPEGLSAP